MMLEVRNFSLRYGNRKIIDDLNFQLNEGEILGVYGKNGCGKSSLCQVIGKVNNHSEIEGEILIDKKNINDMSIAEKCRLVGMIFQEPDTQLFSPTVEDELSFAPENLCVHRKEIEKRINSVLTECSIEHLRNRQTNSLSGGEKQLVAIASVLTMKPKILLADEITSRIDKQNKQRIREILIKFAEDGGAILLVSHNKDDLSIANRIIELKG